MKTSKPNVTIPSQDQITLGARDLVSAALGVIAVVVALDDSKPFFDSLVIGLTVFGVLVGGFRIVVGIGLLLLPIYEEIAYHVRWWSYERRVRWGMPVQYPPPQPPASREPAKVQHGAEEAASVTEGQAHNPKVTSGDAERWADADAQRWGDIASFKLFDKSIDALIDDYEKTMGGIPADMLEALIELGKEIEAAEASRARPATADSHSHLRASGVDRFEDEDRQQEGVHVHPTPHGDRAGSAEVENERQATSGRPPLPRSSRFAVTRFRALLLAMLSVAVAGAFWTTRWQYLESRGPRGMVRMMRVNRWTGATQIYTCGLTQEGAQEIRALQVQLANVMLAPDVLALGGQGLRGLPPNPEQMPEVAEILPCPTCPVDGKEAQEIAERFRSERALPWGIEPRVLDLLERLETTRATHWQCMYR